jgi:geranyl-CoA carboxylase alpha subunit
MNFTKILIANRGEIACRIIRTAQALGYRTVAVYSEADAQALHVALADEAVCIGPAPVRESYLNVAALLAAARSTGADAVHPGYGFLSENDGFAQACLDAGLVFIGPDPQAILKMGNKAGAKRLMLAAGVPCVPGYQGTDQSDATLLTKAAEIGFPIMVKAAAGGGGRGMRLVEHPQDLAVALASARSEAGNAFGSEELILERAVIEPRHVEIQVFGDQHGHIIHLGERDCSIQRRHGGVAARQRRALLLSGDEHAAAGRTPGDRVHHRAGPGGLADRRGPWRALAADAGASALERARHRSAPVRRRSVQRLPAAKWRCCALVPAHGRRRAR